MAKYKVKTSDRKVECELLNESGDQYIVRFKTGVIRSVDKRRVSDLDIIDEAVLDTLRDKGSEYMNKIADKAAEYGHTIADAGRRAVTAVRDLVASVFKAGKGILFRNNRGEVVPAISPVNTMQAALTNKSINFIPGDSVVSLCKEAGFTPRAVENFQYTGEYEGTDELCQIIYKYMDGVSESKRTGSVLDALFEDGSAKVDDYVSLKYKGTGRIRDWNSKEIADELINELGNRRDGVEIRTQALLILGAPGIGKTAIIHALKSVFEGINVVGISGPYVTPDSLSMPATVDVKDEKGERVIDTKLATLPMDWIPVFQNDSKLIKNEKEFRAADNIANGGSVDADYNIVVEGQGGVIFLDELTRSRADVADVLLTLPSDRRMGSNAKLVLGSKWIVVACANRRDDLSTEMLSYLMQVDSANNTRFKPVCFVPTLDEWCVWAEKPDEKNMSKYRKGVPDRYKQNIIPEIINYLRHSSKMAHDYEAVKQAQKGGANRSDRGTSANNPNIDGDFYCSRKDAGNGTLDFQTSAKATPRSWEALSSDIKRRFMDAWGSMGSMGISGPSAYPHFKYVDSLNELTDNDEEFFKSIVVPNIGVEVADRFWEYLKNSRFKIYISDKDCKKIFEKGIPDMQKFQSLKTAQDKMDYLIGEYPFINSVVKTNKAGQKIFLLNDSSDLVESFTNMQDTFVRVLLNDNDTYLATYRVYTPSKSDDENGQVYRVLSMDAFKNFYNFLKGCYILATGSEEMGMSQDGTYNIFTNLMRSIITARYDDYYGDRRNDDREDNFLKVLVNNVDDSEIYILDNNGNDKEIVLPSKEAIDKMGRGILNVYSLLMLGD